MMEDDAERRVIIVSDTGSQSDSEEDTLFLLRHSKHVRARDVGFNIHAVAIGSTGALPGQKQNGHRNVDDSDVNMNKLPQNGSVIRDNSEMNLAGNTSPIVGMETYEMEDYGSREVSYRNTSVHFLDPVELERNQVFKEKKKSVLLSVMMLGLITLFQSVGFILYFSDILLLNVSDITTQSVATIALLITCMISTLLSHAVVNSIGQKWSIFIGCVGSAIFTSGRFFASLPVMIPAAILTGLSTGPFVVGIIRMMTNLAQEYSSLSGKDSKTIFCYFCGVLQSFTLFSPAFSAILRYVFLPFETQMSFTDKDKNILCFNDFCWKDEFGLAIYEQNDVNNRTASDQFRIQAFLGSFLACSLGAALLAWLHTTEGDTDGHNEEPEDTTQPIFPGEPGFTCSCKCKALQCDRSWLVEPLRRFGDRNMMLVAPLCVYLGTQQYLMYSVFLQTYSQCSSQIFHSITVGINLSLVASFCSFPAAYIIAHIGKVKVVLPALACHMILLVVMVMVEMSLPVQYVVAAFWGAADSVIQIAIIVILSEVFSDCMETATVCVRFYQISGYLLLVSLQTAGACNNVILIVTICVLSLAGLCYVAMEIKIRLEQRESRETNYGSQYVPLLRQASWLPDVNPVEVRRDRTESLTSRIPTIK